MNLRSPRRLTLLALVAPTLALVPAAAAHAEVEAAPLVAVSESSTFGPTLPADHVYRQVAVGYSMSYGLGLDGVIEAAGYFADALTPPVAPTGTSWVQIAAGDSHGLALDSTGHVATWGVASDNRSVPASIPPAVADETFQQVTAGRHHDLGLTTDGRVLAWGNPSHLGELEVPAALKVEDPADPVVQVSTAYGVSAARTESGRLVAWGSLLGDEPAGLADETVVEISAGAGHLVVRAADGDLYDWGVYAGGPAPASLADETVVQVESVYQNKSAALTADGDLVVWGDGEGTVPAPRPGARALGIDLGRYRGGVTYGALVATTPPVVEGTPRFGEPLTATGGTWSNTPDEFHYEWRSRNQSGETAVVGTDSATYTPTADDAWNFVTLTVTVTAERDGFVSGTATSERTANVLQQPFTTAPSLSLSGTARVGGTITAVATAAAPTPDDREWTWFTVVRGDDPTSFEDDELSRIEGAETATLALTPDLAGQTVFANLTVFKAGYEAAFGETEDVVVALGELTAPAVSVTGRPRVGQVLTATAVAPTAATAASYQWLRGGAPIAGATARTYRPVAADLGKRLGVRVVSSAPGYSDATGTSTATAPVTLGAVRLKVTVPARATIGKKVPITVRGLAGGERFTVTVAGRRLTGKATGAGVGKVALKVAGKPGKRAVTVVGSVPDRTGAATLRVVRRG